MEEFAEAILRAAQMAVTPQIAINQFRHCKIRVD